MFGSKTSPSAPAAGAADSGSLAGALGRTRRGAFAGLRELLARRTVDAQLLEELEERLLLADVGVAVSGAVLEALQSSVSRREALDAAAVRARLRELLIEVLAPCQQPLVIAPERAPFVILVTGVNGVGKTTTIGKLAHRIRQQGRSVLLAAGDTYRAAAVEQLAQWAARLDVPLISQGSGADSASVIYDALQAARARRLDVLIADTAGRLHTQAGLMAELQKVKRVLGKLDADAPHETLLVVDGGTGQNALSQARQFHEQLGVTGLAVSKLDGTAKGGVLFALAHTLAIPVRFIGVGERPDDLRSFSAEAFVDALLAE